MPPVICVCSVSPAVLCHFKPSGLQCSWQVLGKILLILYYVDI